MNCLWMVARGYQKADGELTPKLYTLECWVRAENLAIENRQKENKTDRPATRHHFQPPKSARKTRQQAAEETTHIPYEYCPCRGSSIGFSFPSGSPPARPRRVHSTESHRAAGQSHSSPGLPGAREPHFCSLSAYDGVKSTRNPLARCDSVDIELAQSRNSSTCEELTVPTQCLLRNDDG